MTDDQIALARMAWAKLCFDCDGIAIATTVEVLQEAGAFAILRTGPRDCARLAEQLGLRGGFFAVACRLLQSQGYVRVSDGLVSLTAEGAAWCAAAPEFAGAARRLAAATCLLRAVLADTETPAAILAEAAELRLWHQLNGASVAAAAKALQRTGRLEQLQHGPLPCSGAALEAAIVLQAAGWMRVSGGIAELTAEGRHSAGFASQYTVPVSYFPTFAAVETILREGIPAETGEEEWHVEREQDIAASGEVVRRSAGAPAIECILPLFDSSDLQAQPQALVDTGSGDGTLLAVLFEAICTRTRRGAALADWPLALVAVEYNEVARRATENRITRLPARTCAIAGDIGRPDAIAAALAAAGLDPHRLLHMSKSVIHNRTYRQPRRTHCIAGATAVFTARDGALIEPGDAYGSLVEFFEDWRPWTRRHGMLVIEAHTVDPAVAARHVGHSLITGLDATHGYSGQMLVEIGAHRAAAEAAGYRRAASHDLGAGMVGVPVMSVDYLTTP